MTFLASLFQACTWSCAVRTPVRRVVVVLALTCAVVAPASAQSVTLSWDPPTSGANVSYVLQYGAMVGSYPNAIPVAQGVTTHKVTGLAPGTYYFVVRAVDTRGMSSTFSNAIRVVIEGTAPPPTDPPPTDPPPTDPPPTEPPPTDPPSYYDPTAPGSDVEEPPSATRLTFNVSTAQELLDAVRGAPSSSTVLLEPGTYPLAEPLTINGVDDLEIRGRTGKRGDVILQAPDGWNQPLFSVTLVNKLRVADLTVDAGTSLAFRFGEGVHRPRLERLHVLGGGAFVLSTRHSGGGGAQEGVIFRCRFETTQVVGTLPIGVDVRGGYGWMVTDSLFTYPRTSSRIPGTSVLVWQGAADTLVERNVFVGGAREIVFGLDPRQPNQHSHGLVRDNMISRTGTSGARGPAISILDAPKAVVTHNSILVSGTSSVGIEFAHPDTRDVYIWNNVLDAPVKARDGASANRKTNLTTATAGMFVAPEVGDLHLRRDRAGAALGKGTPNMFAPKDVDDHARPATSAPDIGADQIVR